MSRKPVFFWGALALGFVGMTLTVPGRPFAQENQIQRAKIFDETYQLITETDFNCSFYMHEEGKLLPDLRIIGAERMNEKTAFSDDDIVYLNKGSADGLEIGQLFLAFGLLEKVGKYGTVAKRLGRARVVRLEERMATAKVEKSCGMVVVGACLVPFEDDPGEMGKDPGFGDMDPNASKTGTVIYIEYENKIAASGAWALINMGRQQCVQIGDRLNIFRRARPDLPREAFASAIIIDVRGATSTIKILSSRDYVDIGSEVQLLETR
jgi:hypothetical protein